MAHSRETLPLSRQMVELGQKIKEFRLSRDLQQQQIADASGVSRRTVSKLEAGEGGTIETLWRVLRALDLGDRVLDLVPDALATPLDTRREHSPRRRASARSGHEGDTPPPPWTWGDE